MGGGSSFDRKNKYYSTKPPIEPYEQSQEGGKIDEEEPMSNVSSPNGSDYVKRLKEEELEIIDTEFNKLARNQVIGKRKILQYFDLQELEGSVLSTAFLFLMKQQKEEGGNSFVDWPKFLSFVVTLSRGTKPERLRLLYGLFNPTYSAQMTKKQFKQSFISILHSLAQVPYENPKVEGFKGSILRAPETQLDSAVDLYIEEIFEEYGSKATADIITYKQWCAWISELCGMDVLLDAHIEPPPVANRSRGRTLEDDNKPETAPVPPDPAQPPQPEPVPNLKLELIEEDKH
jgi:hypothetical protein